MNIIDNFFNNKDRDFSLNKSEYYLGKISSVSIKLASAQVENMSLLKYRFNQQDVLRPSTINYYVLIDSATGIFLGKVVNSWIGNNENVHTAIINSNEDIIYPNIQIQIIALYDGKAFKLPGNLTVGIGDKVYIANTQAIKNYLNSLEIINKYGQIEFSRFDLNEKKSIPFSISVDNLFDHHFMIIGATNSGKSTSALAILDKYHSLNGKFLIIDPTGEYKDSFSQEDKGKVDIKLIGKNLFLNTANLTDAQWISLFRPNDNTQVVELLEAIKKLKFVHFYNAHKTKFAQDNVLKKYIKGNIIDCKGATLQEYKDMQSIWEKDEYVSEPFNILNLYKQIEKDSLRLKSNYGKDEYQFDSFTFGNNAWLIRKVKYLSLKYELKNIFLNSDCEKDLKQEGISKSEEQPCKEKNSKDLNTLLEDFQNNKESLYIGLNNTNFSTIIGKIIVDYVSDFLLTHNMTTNPTLLFIDEVHRYALEKDNQGEFNSPLIALSREGRKNGVFLFLATQSPKDVPAIVLNQIGTMLIHRLTGEYELKSISNFLDKAYLDRLPTLKSGQGILTSVNLIQTIVLNISASKRKHNNQTPSLIRPN